MEFTPVGRICGFCGTVSDGELNFAGGLGALICTRCLDTYHAHYASQEWRDGPHQPWWETMSDEEILATFPKIVHVRDQVEEFLHQWVRVARNRGHTWSSIGRTLGVSRQAAWQRFNDAESRA